MVVADRAGGRLNTFGERDSCTGGASNRAFDRRDGLTQADAKSAPSVSQAVILRKCNNFTMMFHFLRETRIYK